MRLRTFMDQHGISTQQLADGIGLKRSAVGNKVAGLRPWSATEAAAVLAFLRTRTGEEITFEQLFGEQLRRAS